MGITKDSLRGYTSESLGGEIFKSTKKYRVSSPKQQIRFEKFGGSLVSIGLDVTLKGFAAYEDYQRDKKNWNWFRSLIY